MMADGTHPTTPPKCAIVAIERSSLTLKGCGVAETPSKGVFWLVLVVKNSPFLPNL